jgi:hypothetical protein
MSFSLVPAPYSVSVARYDGGSRTKIGPAITLANALDIAMLSDVKRTARQKATFHVSWFFDNIIVLQ